MYSLQSYQSYFAEETITAQALPYKAPPALCLGALGEAGLQGVVLKRARGLPFPRHQCQARPRGARLATCLGCRPLVPSLPGPLLLAGGSGTEAALQAILAVGLG